MKTPFLKFKIKFKFKFKIKFKKDRLVITLRNHQRSFVVDVRVSPMYLKRF